MRRSAMKLMALYVAPILFAFLVFVFWHHRGDGSISFSGVHWGLGLLERTGSLDYNPDVGISSFRVYLYPSSFLFSVTGSSLLAVAVIDLAAFYFIHYRRKIDAS